MQNPERISLKQLAKELGLTRSHARKYILRVARECGFEPSKARTRDSGAGPPALTVSREEADIILRRRSEDFGGAEGPSRTVQNEFGFFYTIQVVPEFEPRRIKLGFAANVEQRLAEHRTSAPTATVARKWPCKRTWERAAIDCAAAGGCRVIANEVYECGDIDVVLRKLDNFFQLMPEPNFAPARWNFGNTGRKG